MRNTLGILILSASLSAGAWAEVCSETALYGHMESLAEHMKPMSQAIRSNDLASATERLPDMLEAAHGARGETPYGFDRGTGDETMEEYREAINQMVEQLETLETALASNDRQAASSAMRALGDLRRDGHRSFMHESCED